MVEKESSDQEERSLSSQEAGESPILEVGRSIVARLSRAISGEESYFVIDEDENLFQALYLTERGSCIPENHVGDDLMTDIINLYHPVLDAVREELRHRLNIPYNIWIHVVPSYEDETHWVMVTEEEGTAVRRQEGLVVLVGV